MHFCQNQAYITMNEQELTDQQDQEISAEQEQDTSTANSSLPVDEGVVDDSASLVKELAEQKDKFIRLLAEFENYKRRTSKERIELFKTAGIEVIKDLLPTLDDIDRAEYAVTSAKDIEAVKDGLKLMSDKLRHTLSQKGLQEINCKGEVFDTDKMEAITEIPAPTPELQGKVVDVLEKGYTLNDKIIRYAKVVVGK